MIEEIRQKIVDVLGTSFFSNEFFHFELWHIVHFIDGAILMFLMVKILKKWNDGEKMFLFSSLLVLHEFAELALIVGGASFISPEPIFDILFDLLIALIGGFLVLTYMNKKRRKK